MHTQRVQRVSNLEEGRTNNRTCVTGSCHAGSQEARSVLLSTRPARRGAPPPEGGAGSSQEELGQKSDEVLKAGDLSTATWHKSTYSDGSGGDCLEAADSHPGITPARDSKVTDGPTARRSCSGPPPGRRSSRTSRTRRASDNRFRYQGLPSAQCFTQAAKPEPSPEKG